MSRYELPHGTRMRDSDGWLPRVLRCGTERKWPRVRWFSSQAAAQSTGAHTAAGKQCMDARGIDPRARTSIPRGQTRTPGTTTTGPTPAKFHGKRMAWSPPSVEDTGKGFECVSSQPPSCAADNRIVTCSTRWRKSTRPRKKVSRFCSRAPLSKQGSRERRQPHRSVTPSPGLQESTSPTDFPVRESMHDAQPIRVNLDALSVNPNTLNPSIASILTRVAYHPTPPAGSGSRWHSHPARNTAPAPVGPPVQPALDASSRPTVNRIDLQDNHLIPSHRGTAIARLLAENGIPSGSFCDDGIVPQPCCNIAFELSMMYTSRMPHFATNEMVTWKPARS